jgi:hypothetical protein
MRSHVSPHVRSAKSRDLALVLTSLPVLLLLSGVIARSGADSSGPNLTLNRQDLRLQGMGPRGLAAEDLNGDEVPDLVVANLGHEDVPGSQTLDVFFGRGDGTFTLAQTIAADTDDMPYGMAVADLRGTGECDIIVPNKCSKTVSVFLGRRDGTFDSPKRFEADDTWSVSTADLDGDQKIDLAVANFDSGAITLMAGNGDGTFRNGEKMAATAGMQPRNVRFGDFDRDGRLDLAVPSDTDVGRVAVYMNQSSPGRFSFAAPLIIRVGAATGAVLVHDLDGDGKLDIAASSLNSNRISVLLGKGDGTFAPPVPYWTGDVWPFEMVLTDLDGDGTPDITVAGVKGITSAALLGDGRGGFSPPIHFQIEGPSRWLTAADFNLDGRMDVAIGNYTLTGRFDAEPNQFFKTVSLLLNRTTQQSERPSVFRTNCGGPAYTDSHGLPFPADSNFEGGKVSTTASTIAESDDQTIYQSVREGDFTYRTQLRAGRSYTIKLLFAEIAKKARKRIFNVSINDVPVLTRFELSSRAPRLTATTVVLRDMWPDRDGQLRLEFSGVKRGAICSGISIF